MTEQEREALPPLPEPEELGMDFDKGWDGVKAYGYTADQMHAYAKEAKRLTPCIQWPGFTNAHGYGRMCIGRDGVRHVRAHVALWESAFGAVPDGKVLDHLCRNRACVNPFHLEAVTVRDNTLRGEGPSAINAKKTHCKHGHEFSGDNLHINQRGRRVCKTCQTRLNREYRARKNKGNP